MTITAMVKSDKADDRTTALAPFGILLIPRTVLRFLYSMKKLMDVRFYYREFYFIRRFYVKTDMKKINVEMSNWTELEIVSAGIHVGFV